MKFLWHIGVIVVCVAALMLATTLLPNGDVICAQQPKPEKVTDIAKKVEDEHTKKLLIDQGIDPDYVELIQDYALSYDANGKELEKKSPYARFYKDRQSGKEIVEISELPMVNANGSFLDTTWATKDGKNFSAGINQFIASVATNKVTVIAINDQPGGKVKKDNVLTFQPQLFLDNKEVKPKVWTPTILAVDPINPNYTNNTLEWDYGICKRQLRLIEGRLFGSWLFAQNPNGEVRIKYNQTGDYKLKLGQYAIDSDTELISSPVFASVTYPFIVSDSLTFYPDAHVETSSVDGYVQRYLAQQTWATVHDSTGNEAWPSHAQGRIGLNSCPNISGRFFWISRFVCLYDTSELPDEATISAAILSVYGAAKQDDAGGLPTANVYSSNPASNTDLVVGDYLYTLWGTTAFATAIAYADFSTTGYNDFTLNADGLAAISKTSVSKFGLREATYDVPNSAPSGWAKNKRSSFNFYSAEQGNGYKPKLVIIYIVPPTVVTNDTQSVEETTATVSGNITATGGENADYRGFEWDTDTGVPYSTNWTEAGDFGVGNFIYGLTGLTEGELYYLRALAHNSGGWGYGSEVTFLTKPDEPDSLVATSYEYQQITLSWNVGAGSDNTVIYGKIGNYPTDRADPLATLVYSGTSNSNVHTGLEDSEHWYYRAWGYATEGGLEQYSDLYEQAEATTLGVPGPPTDFTVTLISTIEEIDSSTVNITWSMGLYADNTTIMCKVDEYPSDYTDGYLVYSGNATSANMTGLSLERYRYFFVHGRSIF